MKGGFLRPTPVKGTIRKSTQQEQKFKYYYTFTGEASGNLMGNSEDEKRLQHLYFNFWVTLQCGMSLNDVTLFTWDRLIGAPQWNHYFCSEGNLSFIPDEDTYDMSENLAHFLWNFITFSCCFPHNIFIYLFILIPFTKWKANGDTFQLLYD